MLDESIFLSENKLMTLASLTLNGGPGAVPVAFMYYKGKFYISSGQKTRKIRNIDRDNRVAFTVEDSTRTKALVGRGNARIIQAQGSQELLRKLITHLVGSLEHPYAKIMSGSDRVIVEITPTSMKSWDLPPTG